MRHTRGPATRKNRGFSLIEVVIALVVGGILLSGLAALTARAVSLNREAEKRNLAAYYRYIYDLKYSLVIARNLTVTSGEVAVERLDGCTRTYRYDSNTGRLVTTSLCPPGVTPDPRVIVDRVRSATFSSFGTAGVCLTLRFDYENFTHTACWSGNA